MARPHSIAAAIDSAPVELELRRNPPPSHYLASGAPQECAHCGSAFGQRQRLPACWRGADERYYCSEACADAARRKTAA
ncbi:MAG TPA: hypothetical protein VNR11_00240 [Xanthobacteraceae bacterium]|nr:hypothetical protein [Xanthobacteraceae bacterium]